MEVEETLIEGTGRGEEGRRRMQSFVLESFCGGGGFTKNLEILVEVEVVDGTFEGRDTEEDVVEEGGEFTTCVKTLEEGEEGVGSTGRKMMPVGFCFFGASFGTSKSSSSESDSEGFRGISVRGGGTS